MRAQVERLYAVDLLRVTSALLVLAYHFGTSFSAGGGPHSRDWTEIATLPAGWAHWSWFGWVGVQVFFVISGFVIAGSARGVTAGKFVARRARRLVPAAWICASVTAALLILAGAAAPRVGGEWLGAVLFVPVAPWIDPSYWTLGIEASFYLLVAATIRQGGAARVEGLAWPLALVSLGFFAAMIAGYGPPDLFEHRWAQLLLLPYGGCFALGILIHRAMESGLNRTRLAGILLCLAVVVLDIEIEAAGHARQFGMSGFEWVPVTIFLAAIGVLVAAPRLQATLRRIAPAGAIPLLGLATYPLYLLHQDAGGALFVMLQRGGIAPLPGILLTFTSVVAASLAIASLFEPRLRGWLVAQASALSARLRPAPIFVGEHAER